MGSTHETEDEESLEGLEEAVHASEAGMKPQSAAGPFVSDSSQPSNMPAGQAGKKEL